MDRITSLPDGVLENVAQYVVGPLSQCSRTLYTRLAVLRLQMHMQYKQRRQILEWGTSLHLRTFYNFDYRPLCWGVAISQQPGDPDEDFAGEYLILWCPFDLFSTDGKAPSLRNGLGAAISTDLSDFDSVSKDWKIALCHNLLRLPWNHLQWWLRQMGRRPDFEKFHSRLALLDEIWPAAAKLEQPSDREVLMGVAAAIAADLGIGNRPLWPLMPIMQAMQDASGQNLEDMPWEWYFELPGYVFLWVHDSPKAAKACLVGRRPDLEGLASLFDAFCDMSGMSTTRRRAV